jgi:hypothetical protein
VAKRLSKRVFRQLLVRSTPWHRNRKPHSGLDDLSADYRRFHWAVRLAMLPYLMGDDEHNTPHRMNQNDEV